jgi:type I restriction enzyme S subunit
MPKPSLNASQKTKHTPAGEIPVDWGCVNLGDVCEIMGGISKGSHRTPKMHPVRYLTVAHVQTNELILSDERFFEVSPQELNRWRLEIGDLLIVEGNGSPDQVGRTALFKGEIADCVHQNHVIRARPDSHKLDSTFVNAYFNSDSGKVAIKRVSFTSSGLFTLSVGRLRDFPIPLPPLPEQRKIAAILGTWDRAIENLQTLIAAKTERKRGLMQSLLTGKKRLPGFTGKWQKRRFGDFLKESRLSGSDGSIASKITVKLYGRGAVERSETRTGSTNTKYYTRRAGQFIYSKLDFLNGAFAILPKQLDGRQSTLDLPAFDINPQADPRWLLAYVTRPEFYETQVSSAAGGRKARRVNPSEFLALSLNIPDIAEQKAIADCLTTATHEITLLNASLQAIHEQKRGLMQNLLSGKIRTQN